MTTKLVIDPVTRIEGHGKVTVEVDDDHNVVDAKLHVVEFRGYEKFIQGHPFWEAPILMQRICGICFVSHHLAGAKVLDDIVGVGPASGLSLTPTAVKMRRLGHYAQMLQSHVTAYFYLVLPEMLFGIDAPPEQRNVLGSDRGGSRAGQASGDAAQVGSGDARRGLRQTDARHLVHTRRREQEPDRRRRRSVPSRC